MKAITEFFFDGEYLKKLITIALPISAQFFVMSALNMVDVIMIGQSGEVPIAAVGIGNQIYFVFSVFVFGISAGTSIFCSQYWGKKEIKNIHRTMGIGLTLDMSVAFIFSLAALLIPSILMALYSNDLNVVTLGSKYLRIVALSYIFTSLTVTFSATLRSTEHVMLPMIASIIAICMNTTLNYILIFGKFGFPALGAEGAAIATLISRAVECLLILSMTYIRKYPAAIPVRSIFDYSVSFLKKYIHIVFPAFMTEACWAIGVTTYMSIYAKISTDAIAAINIASTIETLSYVFFIGIAQGSGILIGKTIGENDNTKLHNLTWRSITFVIFFAFIMGMVLVLISHPITALYKIEKDTAFFVRNILIILGCFFWVKSGNMLFVDGILRNGGDTRFSFFLNFLPIYLIGIPAAVIGTFLLHLPVYIVYLAINFEELIRFIAGIMRIRSWKWVNNLVTEEDVA